MVSPACPLRPNPVRVDDVRAPPAAKTSPKTGLPETSSYEVRPSVPGRTEQFGAFRWIGDFLRRHPTAVAAALIGASIPTLLGAAAPAEARTIGWSPHYATTWQRPAHANWVAPKVQPGVRAEMARVAEDLAAHANDPAYQTRIIRELEKSGKLDGIVGVAFKRDPNTHAYTSTLEQRRALRAALKNAVQGHALTLKRIAFYGDRKSGDAWRDATRAIPDSVGSQDPIPGPEYFPPDDATAVETPGRLARIWTFNDGDGAQAAKKALLESLDGDIHRINALFGKTLPVQDVVLSPGVEGAYHFDDNPSLNVVGTSEARVGSAAEMVETGEALLKNGWDMGKGNGEALSRAIAYRLHPAESGEDARGDVLDWWHGGHPDVINVNRPTDMDPVANGGGLLFLNWLHDKLGYSWEQIIHAGGNNLGETYHRLTGKSGHEGFRAFMASLKPYIDGRGRLHVPEGGSPYI